MDKKQIRPYTLEEEKILREGLDETMEVTYENVATLSVEDPFANLTELLTDSVLDPLCHKLYS